LVCALGTCRGLNYRFWLCRKLPHNYSHSFSSLCLKRCPITIKTRIPFGQLIASGKFVDVASVPGGSNCGCKCPSCNTPLIARQGQIKQWHFAHQSRGVHAEISNECDYSFEMSVRLMLRQLSIEGLTFKTPDFNGFIAAYCDATYQRHVVNFKVTSASTIQLEEPRVGSVFSGVEVDIIGLAKGIPFVVYVTYKGREIPTILKSPETAKCGVVEVNLSGIATKFLHEKNGRYLEALKSYIEKSTEGKTWIYHPRYRHEHAKAKAIIDEWVLKQKELHPHQSAKTWHISPSNCSEYIPVSAPQQEQRKYSCLVCSAYWYGVSRQCKNCNTHLYTKEEIGKADET
jgi:hypothetical protein